MTPPQLQASVELSFSAGMLAICTVGEPGAQGALVAGMQGMGVSAPSAAAVAAATIGFAKELHMPNGGMFNIGTWSMMLAEGAPDSTRLAGNTLSVDGAAPNGHFSIAPEHTRLLMAHPAIVAQHV
jgi:hypothetical protein